MNITPFRSSFCLGVLDSNKVRCNFVGNTLMEAGYTVSMFNEADELYSSIEEMPPHTLFLEQDTLIIFGDDFLDQLHTKLPEVHIIVYAKQEDLYSTSQFIPQGIYDCVAYNQEHLDFLILAADRASERDYFMFMNEQMHEVSAPSTVVTSHLETQDFEVNDNMDHFSSWLNTLLEKRNLKDSVDSFLQEVSRYLNKAEVIYFKYVPSHQSLLASQSVVTDLVKVRGLGVDLIKYENRFSLEKLCKPQDLVSLKSLMNTALGVEKYMSLPFMVQGIPEGVFVFLQADESLAEDNYIQSCLNSLSTKVSQINLIKKMHAISIHDDKTRVLNSENFLNSIRREISRSQRITMPVSLIVVNIDQANDIEQNLNAYEQDMLLKMCATILRRHSRVNDVIGRLDKFTFGLLLPHTGKLGGAIKGERLRRIFESADFSSVIPSHKVITVSIGISEYPSHSRNSDDILKLADEALEEVKRTGKNKVCLASPPEGFIPDFILDGSKL